MFLLLSFLVFLLPICFLVFSVSFWRVCSSLCFVLAFCLPPVINTITHGPTLACPCGPFVHCEIIMRFLVLTFLSVPRVSHIVWFLDGFWTCACPLVGFTVSQVNISQRYRPAVWSAFGPNPCFQCFPANPNLFMFIYEYIYICIWGNTCLNFISARSTWSPGVWTGCRL